MNSTDFVSLLQHPNRPASDRQWSLCIFDDLLEYAGPVSLHLAYFKRRSFEVINKNLLVIAFCTFLLPDCNVSFPELKRIPGALYEPDAELYY